MCKAYEIKLMSGKLIVPGEVIDNGWCLCDSGLLALNAGNREKQKQDPRGI